MVIVVIEIINSVLHVGLQITVNDLQLSTTGTLELSTLLQWHGVGHSVCDVKVLTK